MHPHRTTAPLIGLLFLAATATFLTSTLILDPLLKPGNDLTLLLGNQQNVVLAVWLALLDGLAILLIAAWMSPLLKPFHPALAAGFLGFKIAELFAILLYCLSPMLLLTLAGQTSTTPPETLSALQSLLMSMRSWCLQMLYLFNGMAGVMFCVLLLKSRWIPAGLSSMGLLGYLGLPIAVVLHTTGLMDTQQGAGMLFFVPGGLFELILPFWLFFKGFRQVKTPLQNLQGTGG
ncbi:DUF4386 domain-containing protein [Deinococcus roseus]|uniref:DUF4386 domain-containing protein n=1 Tax=Deinococcus roseus TaxID=392414 RepID=A0ABQ2D6R8_9DEIO|nr:DUF4386 domain-containing protein [Deinococcus roseus]GGJ46698.1 hypothetical protein GCM10008938_36040 [Deinococcus roseus]